MLRKTLFWIHLVVGLFAAVPLATMALTGILLAFAPQITRWAQGEDPRIPTPGLKRLSLDTLVARSAGDRARLVGAMSMGSEDGAVVELRLGREERLRVDPWTGEVLRHGVATQRAFSWIERIHRWLGSRDIGGAITGSSVLLCLVLCASGLVLWWPRRWIAMKNVVWPRSGLRGRARDWQWHNAIGFLVLPLLLVVALTGTVMSWKWAESILYTAAGSESPRKLARGGAAPRHGERPKPPAPRHWQAWMDTATRHAPGPWVSAWLSAPSSPEAPPSVFFRSSLGAEPSGGTVVLDGDGRFTAWKPARDDRGTRLRFLVRPLHTGELFGWAGQAAMAIACAGTLALAWTGVSLSWHRFRRRRS